MWRSTGLLLRRATTASARKRQRLRPRVREIDLLKLELASLRASNEIADRVLNERRRSRVQHARFATDGIHTPAPGNSRATPARPASAKSKRKRKGRRAKSPHRRRLLRRLAAEQLPYESDSSGGGLPLLPRNPQLEAALSMSLAESHDARPALEFTRRLLQSVLLSLASPCRARWDPYDIQPQLFALDNYVALPVFTSVEYLQIFCEKFGFATRDPSGRLWADGTDASATERAGEREKLLLPRLVRAVGGVGGAGAGEPPGSAQGNHTNNNEGERREAALEDADTLFDIMGETAATAAADANVVPSGEKRVKETAKKLKKKRKKKKGRRGKKKDKASATAAFPPGGGRTEDPGASASAADYTEFWERVSRVRPFHLRQATPLPTHGPFLHPFFIGYFTDIHTLLHSTAELPDRVDIVLNPASPLEFVLPREATDEILSQERILLRAYQRVERELQREFSAFLQARCPEVAAAWSACVPRPLDRESIERELEVLINGGGGGGGEAAPPLEVFREQTSQLREAAYTGGAQCELVILLKVGGAGSDGGEGGEEEEGMLLASVYSKLQRAKHTGELIGHRDLDVLPIAAAAPHVQECATLFYERSSSEASDRSRRRLREAEGGSISAEDVELDSKEGSGSAGGGVVGERLGVFRRVGEPAVLHVRQDADSYFHDPSNAYTEAHAVFTEELKIKRGQ